MGSSSGDTLTCAQQLTHDGIWHFVCKHTRQMRDFHKLLSCLLVTAGFIYLLALPARAQTAESSDAPSTVVGTATDTNGNPLEGATVTLVGIGQSGHPATTSNENGYFEFHNVAPRNVYQLTIHAPGFADWTSSDFTVQSGEYKIVTDSKLRVERAQTTVNVNYSPVEVATQQVEVAEKQRVLGIIPNFYVVYDSNPEPLTTKLKFKLAWRVSRDPVTVAGVGFMAGVKQMGNSPDFEQGASGYAKRVGVTAADGFADIMIGGAILPSLLHQDPRYYYQGTGSTTSRLLHAVSAPFVCKGDNGHTQPNYSSLGGDLAVGALSNAYFPTSNRGVGLVFGSFAIGTAERVAASVAQEFLLRKLTPKQSK
jgi:Carboxypeptidase regulatory-like domain